MGVIGTDVTGLPERGVAVKGGGQLAVLEMASRDDGERSGRR